MTSQNSTKATVPTSIIYISISEDIRAVALRERMSPAALAIFVVVPLLCFYVNYDIAFFSAVLPSQLTTVATLLVVAQPFSAQVTPSSSCLLHMLHRPTSMVFALASVTHHVAHAAYKNVTAETIAHTRYNDTAVSINGSDIVIDLNETDAANDIYFAFHGHYQFRLEKCPTKSPARIVIENHKCKWAVDWNDEDCSVRANEKSTKWILQFPVPKRGEIQSLLFRYDESLERMQCDDNDGVALGFLDAHELCMWTSAVQGDIKVSAINVTYPLETNCPVKVVIIKATLYTTVPETKTPPPELKVEDVSDQPADEEGLQTWHIVCIAIGGLLLLLLVVGGIGMSVFIALTPPDKGGKRQAGKQGTIAKILHPSTADALIEWEDVQAHMPYRDTTTQSGEFKSRVSTDCLERASWSTGNEYLKYRMTGWVEMLEPIVGDYGHVKAQYVNSKEHPNRERIHIYYSWSTERLRKFEEMATLAHRAAKGTDRHVLVVDVQARCSGDVRDWNRNLHFLITQELGPLLGAFLTQFENECMSLHDAANYAYSSLQALRSLHQAGIVHRDVSPFAFALEVDRPQTLLMTHLSLARKIYDTETKTFVPRRRRVNFFGTVEFASRAAHKRQERSFKDDVESWFYTIFDLVWPGYMPWHNLQYDQTKDPAEKAKLHTEYAKLKEEFLRSFADTENPRNAQAPGPIFASIADQVLKSKFESQTEEFAPELAKKLEAFAKAVPEASKEKEGLHPLRKFPEKPRCRTDKYIPDHQLPAEVRNARPGVLY